jgi:cell division protein FtsB
MYMKKLERTVKKLEEENGYLRKEYDNSELLKEQKHSLEKRIENAVQLQQECNELAAENVKLKHEKAQW